MAIKLNLTVNIEFPDGSRESIAAVTARMLAAARFAVADDRQFDEVLSDTAGWKLCRHIISVYEPRIGFRTVSGDYALGRKVDTLLCGHPAVEVWNFETNFLRVVAEKSVYFL